MTQHIIWYADQPYVCGAGLDGDIYDQREDAEAAQWVTNRDTPRYRVLPYVECAEGQTPPDPVPPGGYQAGFYQTDDGQVFHVNGRDMDQKTMDALQEMVKAAVRMVDREERRKLGRKRTVDEKAQLIALTERQQRILTIVWHLSVEEPQTVRRLGEALADWNATDAERAAAVEALRADLPSMIALHLVTLDDRDRVAFTHMGFGHAYAVSLWTQGVSPKLAREWGWAGVPIPKHPMKLHRPTEEEKRLVWDIHDPGEADAVNAWWNEDDHDRPET